MTKITADLLTQERLKASLAETHEICSAFFKGLVFVASDTARDPTYLENHLLSYLFQDLIQSAVAVPLLAARCSRRAAPWH